MGFYPPFSAQVAEASATALPAAGPFTPLSSLAALNKADEPAQSPRALPAETVTRAHTKGSCNRTLLRRVLRRFSTSRCFLEEFLEGAW